MSSLVAGLPGCLQGPGGHARLHRSSRRDNCVRRILSRSSLQIIPNIHVERVAYSRRRARRHWHGRLWVESRVSSTSPKSRKESILCTKIWKPANISSMYVVLSGRSSIPGLNPYSKIATHAGLHRNNRDMALLRERDNADLREMLRRVLDNVEGLREIVATPGQGVQSVVQTIQDVRIPST